MKLLRDLFRLRTVGRRVSRARRHDQRRAWHVTVPAPRGGGDLHPAA